MSRFLRKAGWIAALLFIFYWQARQNKRLAEAIEQMNYELDKADDHIFAMTIELDNLIDQNIDLIRQVEEQNVQAVDTGELLRSMCVMNASGFYSEVLFHPDNVMVVTNRMSHIPMGHN